MAQLSFGNVKTYRINGKQVKTLRLNGVALKSDVTVSFSLEMNTDEYYYISGQSGTSTTQVTPSSRTYTPGDTYGTLPEIGTLASPLTYVLNSRTYNIYVSGWYTDSTYTTQVVSTDTVNSDIKLYAKWSMTADVTIYNRSSSKTYVSFTIPKFIYNAYWECNTGGKGRKYISSATSSSNNTTWGNNIIDYEFVVSMSAPGDNNTELGTRTFTNVGGKSLELDDYKCTIGTDEESVTEPTNVAISGYYVTPVGSTATTSTLINSGGLKAVATTTAPDSSFYSTVTLTLYYNNTVLRTCTMGTMYKPKPIYGAKSLSANNGPYSGEFSGSDSTAPKGAYYVTKFSTPVGQLVTATVSEVENPNYYRTFILRA